jgi:hypothetical protein
LPDAVVARIETLDTVPKLHAAIELALGVSRLEDFQP